MHWVRVLSLLISARAVCCHDFAAPKKTDVDDFQNAILPADAVKRVKQGMGFSTYAVDFMSERQFKAANLDYIQRMADEGLVSVLLDLLNQCEKSIDDVRKYPSIGSEGQLRDPTPWIKILYDLTRPDL